ncbi:MAG: MFS transporter [Ilumatobacteraceae bacterium]
MSVPAHALPHPHRPGTARAAFSYRDFRLIWLGLFASNIGTWMQNFTLPAYVEHRTESATLVGLLVFMQLGPLLLLSIPAGVLADRFPRRPYLVVMQSVQLVFSVVLAVLVAGDAPLWTLFGAALLIGIGNALNAPAFQASVPLLVQRPDLAGAVSMNSVMVNASRVLGPALAAILALFGVTTSQLFLVNAATYLFLIAAIVLVHIPDVRGQHPEEGWRRLLTGLNIARGRTVLSRCLITMCVFSTVCLVYVGLFPSVARRNFGVDVDSAGYKLLYTTWGVGACLGALAVGTVLAHFDRRRLVVDGMLLFAVSLAGFAVVRSVTPAYPIAFVLGFAYFLTTTALITIFQENLADTERAVVMPLWFMAFGGSIPIGNLLFGPVIDAVGARWVLGLGVVFAIGLARWCDLRRLPPEAFLPLEIPHRAPTDSGPVAGHGIVAD